jgi:hypothetical protein
MVPLHIVFDSWADVPLNQDDVTSWFAPGRVIRLEQLAARSFTPHRLTRLPLDLVIMCVRDEDMAIFHVDMLKRLDHTFSSVELLYSPWLDQLTPMYSAAIGLDADRLLEDGLTRQHVRQVFLRLSEWRTIFKLENSHIKRLGIQNLNHCFDDVATDLAENGHDASLLSIHL